MTDAEIRDAALADLKQTTRGLSGYSPPATSHWGKALALLAQVSFYISERDAAVAELRLTTVGYNYYKGALPPAGSHWGKALAYLKEVGVPVSVTLSTSGDPKNLKGTVTLTASPTAGGQVTSVKFFVDDVLKSTDTIAPYTYSWDTTTVQDGSHQLKAQALYTKNQMAEKKLDVTVSNNPVTPPPPPPPPIQGPPVNVTVPTISGTATEGQTLSISEMTTEWTNSPTSYAHQWDRCDAAGANCIDIASARASTYLLSSVDVGSTIRCWTTASNAYGTSAPVLSAQTAVVGALTPAVPTNTIPPVINGNPVVGSALTISNGGWTNSPTSYGHCWDRCDANGANCADIANGQDCTGATPNATYVVTSADVGSTIKAYTKAYNATGASAAILSAATAVVTAPPPSPPPTGQVLFDGDFDLGIVPPWDEAFQWAAGRITRVTSDAGVTPRKGTYFGRFEVRSGDQVFGGTNIAQVIRYNNVTGHYDVVGAERYVGFSMFIPNGYAYVPNQLFNNIFEWHGDNAGQAPTTFAIDSIIGSHYGITNSQVGLIADIQLDPSAYMINGFMFRMGNLSDYQGRWVDVVFHFKWSSGTDGMYEGWLDGVKKFSYAGRTWATGTSSVKPQLGPYRQDYSQTSVMYCDCFKIGTSYTVVAP